MRELFKSLLVSAPNNGGFFLVAHGDVHRLDGLDTTGLSLDGGLFLRAQQQPPSLWICDGRRLAALANLSSAFDDLHDVICFDEHIYVVGTARNEIVKLNRAGREVRRWSFPGQHDSRHINCLAIWQKRIVFSAFGDFIETRGYKGRTLENG